MANSVRELDIMRAAYRKLDNMPLGFGVPEYSDDISDEDVSRYFGLDLRDTMRELKLRNLDNLEEMSQAEMHIENRTVYYALKRYRNSSSIFFKFSTATDGKTIDKSMIPKMIAAILKDLDDEFKEWRSSTPAGSMWNMVSTVKTSGGYDTTLS